VCKNPACKNYHEDADKYCNIKCDRDEKELKKKEAKKGNKKGKKK